MRKLVVIPGYACVICEVATTARKQILGSDMLISRNTTIALIAGNMMMALLTLLGVITVATYSP
jgi:hypothetical protein